VSDDDGSLSSQWVQRCRLGDSRSGVSDIAFGPRHVGLELAVASMDGTIRVYRAGNAADLTHWDLDDDFMAVRGGVSSVSWCDSRFSPQMMVVGGAAPTSVSVWAFSGVSRWSQVCVLPGHMDAVHDVAWAPNAGRSFHLIASASRDGTVRLWHLTASGAAADDDDDAGAPGAASASSSSSSASAAGAGGGLRLESKLVAVLDEHKGQVWRVRWNLTGTTLASTGDDGAVRLWNQSLTGEWKCASTISIHDDLPARE
jgi:nucleoporin SEH1